MSESEVIFTACKHSGEKLEYGTKCKIVNKKCIFLRPDEKRCLEENGGIINYLNTIGTYAEKVENNLQYTS